MKCPFCKKMENRVIDSRISREGDSIRRRRLCLSCNKRFTTYERIEGILPLVIKKDNRRESFDRNKIIIGMKKACEKRPISIDQIEMVANRIEGHFMELGEKEIKSSDIGEMVIRELQAMDEVAYVRFASVYRQFKDITQFVEEVKRLIDSGKRIASS
jgi:transcriptional repressor NrdR